MAATPGAGRRLRAAVGRWAVPLAAAVAFVVVTGLLWSRRDDETAFVAAFAAVAQLAVVASVGAFLWAWWAAARGSALGRAWLLVAAGILLSAVASGLLDAAGGPAAEAVGSSGLLLAADAARITSAVLLVWGLLRLPEADGVVPPRAVASLDVVTVAMGSAAVVWFVTFGVVIDDVGAAEAVTSFTPVLYAAAFFTAAARWRAGVHPGAERSVAWTALALFLSAGVDSYVASIVGAGREVPLTAPALFLPAVGAMVATAAAGASAVVDRRRVATRSRRPSERVSLVAPVVGLLVVQALLAVALAREPYRFPWVGLVVASVVTTLSAGLRQVLALRENHRLLETDPLTGLANRAGLRARLGMTSAERPRPDAGAAIVCDLDDFKEVNDAYGHDAGDRLLRHFASVLERSRGSGDFAARLGGDEFAVVMASGAREADAIALARRILDLSATPVPVGPAVVRPRVSIGVAAGSGRSVDALDLLRRADSAMYRAKKLRGEGLALYDPATGQAGTAGLADDLERALRSGGLRLEYQPLVVLPPGGPPGERLQVRGVEALVRWDHPVRGTLSPLVFVPVAERAGLAAELGEWILERACRQVAEWRSLPGGRDLELGVNVSPVQFERTGLVAAVDRVLTRTGMDAARLVIEITESALIDDLGSVPTLAALRERGIRIALDDFGTGYSSLQYLTRLPVDEVKLDRGFVGDLGGGRAGAAVAEAVARLAEALGLATVAEGIEDEAQARRLAAMGYSYAQGFLYAPPLPPENLADLLVARGEVSVLPGR